LHSELYPDGGMTRDEFEEVLGDMARSGLVRLIDAVFEKDGKTIPYRKASLASAADALDGTAPMALLMKMEVTAVAVRCGKRKKKSTRGALARPGAIRKAAVQKASGARQPQAASDSRVEAVLRNWRLAEAKRRGVPAFRVFGDQAKATVAKRPGSAAELLAIPGIGINRGKERGDDLPFVT
jgi:superfamily II DNA helicase RecQ